MYTFHDHHNRSGTTTFHKPYLQNLLDKYIYRCHSRNFHETNTPLTGERHRLKRQHRTKQWRKHNPATNNLHLASICLNVYFVPNTDIVKTGKDNRHGCCNCLGRRVTPVEETKEVKEHAMVERNERVACVWVV
jgi:hypothetical protein